MPRPGDVVHVGPDASVQFRNGCDFLMRVIRHEPATYDPAWAHVTGYQLGADGIPIERRTVYVRIAGLRPVGEAPAVRRPVNAGPVAVPRQRTRPNTTVRSHR